MASEPPTQLPDLKGMTLPEIETFFAELGKPRYRADQVASWIFGRSVSSFNEMTNLSRELRESLEETARITASRTVAHERSAIDGTEKLLLEFPETKDRIETVILRSDERVTGCISTQIGCRFACRFCATGAMGLIRSLTAGEIVEQVLALRRQVAPDRLNNIVFMGMGEPLDNYDAVMRTIRIANAPWGLGIGARRMTISTSGIAPGIRRLAGEGLQINLAVSLNAPIQELREHLMPVAGKYPLDELLAAMREFVSSVGRLITIEYVLLRGINDSPEMASLLGDIAAELFCRVNLICYNEVAGTAYAPPSSEVVGRFITVLKRRCPTVVRRMSRGSDISAACGQLHTRAGRAR
ncbi:23S rRNA (adenine(2503)-C(2))-methyltransferase RlmN [bacterium]|nr:23S rRNA (adenine(2503)-C(2))-methyltransferase RlmN [bacterium]